MKRMISAVIFVVTIYLIPSSFLVHPIVETGKALGGRSDSVIQEYRRTREMMMQLNEDTVIKPDITNGSIPRSH